MKRRGTWPFKTFQVKKLLSFVNSTVIPKKNKYINCFPDFNSPFQGRKNSKVGKHSIVILASKLFYKLFTTFSVTGLVYL